MLTSPLYKAIKSLQLPEQRPLVIAISGFGGSGKTTLANELKTALKNAMVVSIDSFVRGDDWHRDAEWSNFDRDRFVREILKPARKNYFPLTYRHEPWPGHAENVTKQVLQTEHLIVEGCSILHPDLLEYYDYKIWLDCSLEESTKRGMERDRHVNNDEQDQFWQSVWMPNEKDFFGKYRPDKAADTIINTLGQS